jgi:hypothetical protein
MYVESALTIRENASAGICKSSRYLSDTRNQVILWTNPKNPVVFRLIQKNKPDEGPTLFLGF